MDFQQPLVGRGWEYGIDPVCQNFGGLRCSQHGAVINLLDADLTQPIGGPLGLGSPFLAQLEIWQSAVVNLVWIVNGSMPNQRNFRF